jgi:opacity protein-like surface antigen
MKKTVTVAAALILLMAMPMVAQEEEEYEVSPIAFQGRVGAMYTGGEPFENGATFEVAALFHTAGPLYLNIFGGISNFDSEGDVIPITDEFIAFWDDFTANVDILDMDSLRYRVNYVGAGATAALGAGRLEPQVFGGVGAYQVKFITSLNYVEKVIPEEFREANSFFGSFEDSKWFLGYSFGGGLYYRFNQIINFGGAVTYHYIDTDVIEDLVSFTFGLHIRVP